MASHYVRSPISVEVVIQDTRTGEELRYFKMTKSFDHARYVLNGFAKEFSHEVDSLQGDSLF